MQIHWRRRALKYAKHMSTEAYICGTNILKLVEKFIQGLYLWGKKLADET